MVSPKEARNHPRTNIITFIYIYTNEYKAATDLTVSNLLTICYFRLTFEVKFCTNFVFLLYRYQIELGTELFFK